MPRRPASERRVVELGSTLKLQPAASPHPVHDQLFGGTGTIAGAQGAADPSPGAGRRRKKPPGMARRSTRNWARPARQPEAEADEQERPPEPQPEPEPEFMAPPPADLGPVAVGDGIVADSNFIEDDWDDEEE